MKSLFKYLILSKWQLIGCLLLFFSLASSAQKHDNNWLICSSHPKIYSFNNDSFQFTGLEFFTSITPDANVQECRAIISDSVGNYQFLCNGYTVLNKEFKFMKGLTANKCLISPKDTGTIYVESGSTSAGAAMILPRPQHSNQYIIFHFNLDRANSVSEFDTMYYSLVDMTADSGRGAIISIRNVIAKGNFSGTQFAAIKHANGVDWWIATTEQATNKYYSFLLKSDTILGPYTQSIGISPPPSTEELKIRFNSDGTKVVNGSGIENIQILDFDRCTGLLSNPFQFQNINPHFIGQNDLGGLTIFSPSGRFLYVTHDYIAWQFDLWASDIPASRIQLYDTYPNRGYFSDGQLALNGEIYFGIWGRLGQPNVPDKIGYIEFPDSTGLSCNVCLHCIDVSPSLNLTAPSSFPNFRLKASLGYDSLGVHESRTICAGTSLVLSTQPYKKHYLYQVSTNGTHYTAMSSNELPVTPTQTTTYYFRTTDNSIDSNCHRNYKVDTVVVNVLPSATNLYQADAGNDTSICPNKTVTLGAANNPTNLHYQWFTANQQFSTESHPTLQPAATATYTLRITDPLIDTTCAIKRDTVTVTIEPCPIIIPTLLFNTFKITNLPENTAFQLFDLLGRKVFESSNYQNDFDTRILSNGVYLFRFTDAGGSVKKGRVLVIN